MTSNETLLKIKKQTVTMFTLCGYDTSDDTPVLSYEPEDMEDYFEYAFGDTDHNAIRKLLRESSLLTPRTSMSTIYESKIRPNHFAVVYFTPDPISTSNSISKSFIQGPVCLCGLYPFAKQIHCVDCVEELNAIKKCPNCPLQQYCAECIDELRCENCPTEKWCASCENRLRRWSNYTLSNIFCKDCPQKGEEPFCESCQTIRGKYLCQDCSTSREDHLITQECIPCTKRMKCNQCPAEEYCGQCEKVMKFKPCDKCPESNLCKECLEKNDFRPCTKCPPAPQIIERFVIVAQMPLSAEAKQTASGTIPRIKASTGEMLESGCLIQVFMDGEILDNPMINSLGSKYKILTIEEGKELFNSKVNSISENQIHFIDMNEITCRYLGLYPGCVVRIEQKQVVPGGMTPYTVIYKLVRLIPNVRKNRKRGIKKKPIVASGTGLEDEF